MIFDNLVGNNNIKEILKESLKNNNVVHSYLFYGEEGIGKKEFAIQFSKGLLCMSEENKPCNICKSCIEFDSDNNPDFFIIEPDGNSIKINQIRLFQKSILEKPINSRRKIYIINDADKMTVEAQNCLLKTLEEPQEFIVIILIAADENKLLNTVKSRCTKIFFQKLKNDEVLSYIQGKNCDVHFDENMLELCEGSIGKALNILNQKGEIEKLKMIVEQMDIMNELELLNCNEFFYENKDTINFLLDYMYILFFKKLKLNHDKKYINAMEEVQRAKQKLANSNNFDMTIDNMLIKIWGEF